MKMSYIKYTPSKITQERLVKNTKVTKLIKNIEETKNENNDNVGYVLIKDINDSKNQDIEESKSQNKEESKGRDNQEVDSQNDNELKSQNDDEKLKDQNDEEMKNPDDEELKIQNDESSKDPDISSSIDFEKKFLIKDHSRPLDRLSSPKIESIPNESLMNQNRSQFEIETIELDHAQLIWKQTPLYQIAEECLNENEIIEKSLDLK